MPTAPNATALAACSGVSALVRTLMRVASEHHFISCWKFLNFSVCLAAFVAVDQAGDDLRRRGLDLAGVDLADRPVDRHPVAFLERLAVDRHRARLVVDFDRRGAADADLAHLPARPAPRATRRRRAR